jgi:hypothetical protein
MPAIQHLDSFLAKIRSYAAESKVWIFYSDRTLSEGQFDEIQTAIDTFLASWKAHNQPVTASGVFLLNRVIVISADAFGNEVSGCATDACVHFIKELGNRFDCNFMDRKTIVYFHNESFQITDIVNFVQKIIRKEVEHSTLVMNPYYTDLIDFVKNFLLPVSDSIWRPIIDRSIKKIEA